MIPIGLPLEPMFAPLQDATFAEEGILGHNYLAHTYSALPPFHRSEKKEGGTHQEKLPKACGPVVAELGVAQESAVLSTGCPEARKVLHFLHGQRKRYLPTE